MRVAPNAKENEAARAAYESAWPHHVHIEPQNTRAPATQLLRESRESGSGHEHASAFADDGARFARRCGSRLTLST
jgi:hypothetical protein